MLLKGNNFKMLISLLNSRVMRLHVILQIAKFVRQNHQCVAEAGSDFDSSPVKLPGTSYLPKCTQEAMTNVGSCNHCSTSTRSERTWSESATVQRESSASAPTVNNESTKDYQALSSSSPEASNSSLTLDPASKVSQSIRSYRKDVGLTTSESHSYSRVLSPLNEEEILTSGNPHLIRPQLSTTTISGHEITKNKSVQGNVDAINYKYA
ncbi:hypothetical protein GJ496_006164 [Pomphorhynchus laevis]|nr:hypothetical protein GJ496_006164 [Pomphorhynchus laevis]